jgi:hypothetical protein
VLDGINAACGLQGLSVNDNEAVGEYRQLLVLPLTAAGCTVLSLGHPVKDLKRQGESYSYGAAGWTNDVDGASYRLTSSKNPIRKGASGSSALICVKDRYSEVKRWGELQTGNDMPQYYMGQFIVDDDKPEDSWGVYSRTEIRLSVPVKNEEGEAKDTIDVECDKIQKYLQGNDDGRFPSKTKLISSMRAAGVSLSQNVVEAALQRLANHEVIEWPEVEGTRPRPGWLTLNPLPVKGFQ